MKLIEDAHVHKYTKRIKSSVTLWDHRKINGENVEPGVAGKDIIHKRKCECGLTQAYDMERINA